MQTSEINKIKVSKKKSKEQEICRIYRNIEFLIKCLACEMPCKSFKRFANFNIFINLFGYYVSF